MGKLNFEGIGKLTEARMLRFLNQAFRPQDILRPLSKRQSQDGEKDYGIGPVVAKRLLEAKKQLPRRRFQQLEDLNGIKGFGQDKLQELMAIFKDSTAEKFKAGLYDKKILFDNFKLKYVAISFESEEEFLATVNDPAKIRQAAIDNLGKLADEQTSDADLAEAKEQLKNAYFDVYEIANIASYEFALWFYKFDQDNWFGYETIRAEIEPFLTEVYNRKCKKTFALLKGLDQGKIAHGGVTVEDLPIVFSQEEKAIYIWSAQLFD